MEELFITMLNENVKEAKFSEKEVSLAEKIVENYVYSPETSLINNMELSESINIITEFISCLPKKYQKEILKLLRENKITFEKDEEEGLRNNRSNFYEINNVIQIFYRNNIGDIFNIIHEVWHYLFLNEKEKSLDNDLLENPIIMEYKLYMYLKTKEKFKYLDSDLENYMKYRYNENYNYALEILFKNEIIKIYKKEGYLDRKIILKNLNETNNYNGEFLKYYEDYFSFIEAGHVFNNKLYFQYNFIMVISPSLYSDTSKIIRLSENFLEDDKILEKIKIDINDENLINNYSKFYEPIINNKKTKSNSL